MKKSHRIFTMQAKEKCAHRSGANCISLRHFLRSAFLPVSADSGTRVFTYSQVSSELYGLYTFHRVHNFYV